MTLFDHSGPDSAAPLAARMRPRTLAEIVGQTHLTAPGSVFRKSLDSDTLPSLILHGPAGTGKSTLARIVAASTQHCFEERSAVAVSVGDIRELAKQASDQLAFHGRKTIFFLDEIHRLNKAQQDQFLPHVEAGTFTLIGATTENPYFTVISPLLSRCRLFTLEKLSVEELEEVMVRAVGDEDRGLGKLKPQVSAEALAHLAAGAAGDARAALNALDLATQTAPRDSEGRRRVNIAEAEAALQQPVLKYDRAGDEHYDTISAFIKSVRGSDPDAAIYWLAKMIEAGEDPRFIARRIVILAAEDVGLADPTGLRVAVAAADAVEYVGMPEAQIPLAMATIHLAVAPKSNTAYQAISAARQDVRNEGGAPVPPHLAGGVRPDDARDEYLHPHEFPGGWVRQPYLPPAIQSRQYYQPKGNPRETRIAAHLAQLRQAEPQPGASAEERADGGLDAVKGENLESRD